jgi:hypothetical protein
MTDLHTLIQLFANKKIPFEEQTPELCMSIVKYNGVYLSYIDNQYDELCAEAIRQNPIYLYFVKKQTPELCLLAIRQNGQMIQFVHEQTPEMCIEAVKNNPEYIIFTKYKPYKILKYETIINVSDECPICYDNNHDWCKLSCGHKFHIPCIKKCVETKTTCPICRQDINFTWLVM